MPVTSDSYEAKVLTAAIAMLTGSATFRTLVGATDAAAATAFVVESDGGAPDERTDLAPGSAIASDGSTFTFASTPAWAEAHTTALDSQLVGVAVFDHTGQVTIVVHQARVLSTETPAEAMRRARNILGEIRADIEALFGTSGCLATGTVKTDGPYLPNSTGADGDGILGHLIIDWFA